MLGNIEGRRRGRQRMRWLDGITDWMDVSVNSRSWWWTERPGVLRFMGSQRVGHDWATELKGRPHSSAGCGSSPHTLQVHLIDVPANLEVPPFRNPSSPPASNTHFTLHCAHQHGNSVAKGLTLAQGAPHRVAEHDWTVRVVWTPNKPSVASRISVAPLRRRPWLTSFP